MNNFPRVPRDYRRTEAKVEKGIAAFGCFALMCWLLFWGTVIFVIAHFVMKYW